MIKGFKEFLMRGNVVDLATAVVVGAAFTAVVTAFTGGVIDPLLAAIGGADNVGLGFTIRRGNENTFVDLGGLIAALLNFLIVAAAVYFLIVMPISKLQELRKRGQVDEPEPLDQGTVLLQEIRDLLAAQAGEVPGAKPGTVPPATPSPLTEPGGTGSSGDRPAGGPPPA